MYRTWHVFKNRPSSRPGWSRCDPWLFLLAILIFSCTSAERCPEFLLFMLSSCIQTQLCWASSSSLACQDLFENQLFLIVLHLQSSLPNQVALPRKHRDPVSALCSPSEFYFKALTHNSDLIPGFPWLLFAMPAMGSRHRFQELGKSGVKLF